MKKSLLKLPGMLTFAILIALASVVNAKASVSTNRCKAPSNLSVRFTLNRLYPWVWDMHFAWAGHAEQFEYEVIGTYPITGATSENYLFFPGVEAGIGITFNVRCYCSATAQSEWTTLEFAVPRVYCPDPGDVQLVPEQNGFSLSWTYPIKPRGYEYVIWEAESGAFVRQGFADSTYIHIEGLKGNTSYKVNLNIYCDPFGSGPENFKTYIFRTLPVFCPDPENVIITPYFWGFLMSWTYPVKVPLYEYIVTETESGERAAEGFSDTTFIDVGGLRYNTDFTIKLKIYCDPYNSVPTHEISFPFHSMPDYCVSWGASSDRDYIQLVKLNALERTSGNDYGYIATNMEAILLADSDNWLFINSGGINTHRFAGAWIDYNNDGDFYDEDERVGIRSINNNKMIKMNIKVPPIMNEGTRAMRIVLERPHGKKNRKPDPCREYAFGETEDYLVTIRKNNPSIAREVSAPSAQIVIYPNPVSDRLTITGAWPGCKMAIKDSVGKKIYQGDVLEEINVSGYTRGLYYLIIYDGRQQKTFRFFKK